MFNLLVSTENMYQFMCVKVDVFWCKKHMHELGSTG